MGLLKNAIFSIEVGIEDYKSGEDKRNISAVRNVFAAILLLFKEKLVRLSPEYDKNLLIKNQLLPSKSESGEIIFISKGNKTVDFAAIKDRFVSLGIKIDWKRLEEIQKLRTDLEHYYTDKSPEKVREILAKSFLIIRDFLVNELNENPASIIDRDCWASLLELGEVYAAEEHSCKESFRNFQWKYKTLNEAIKHIRCCFCESSLVKLVKHDPYESSNPELFKGYLTVMACNACDETIDYFPDVFEQCIKDYFFADAYISATQGGMPPYEDCPECGKGTFVFDEMCCVACDYTLEYQNCARCHQSIGLEEQDLGGLCSYCSNLAHKIMNE